MTWFGVEWGGSVCLAGFGKRLRGWRVRREGGGGLLGSFGFSRSLWYLSSMSSDGESSETQVRPHSYVILCFLILLLRRWGAVMSGSS